MGSGIAAHIANAGLNVVLLDIVPSGAKDRSMLAKGAIEKMLKADPAPFMHKRNAKKITTGNLEDDLDQIKDCDWIIEVVLEDARIKSDLYKKLDGVRKKGSIISSNTSSIPLHTLTEGQSKDFAKDFLVTHFFNPPRYMRLLELVTGKDTRAEAAKTIREFCDIKLGKGVVECHDTPGFIANRIGAFWLQCSVNETINLGLKIEEADLVMSRPVGIPKTGVFGLIDLVGLDLMPHLAKSLLGSLPKTDAYAQIHKKYPVIAKLIADGYTGRKGKGGFYRLNKEGGGKVKEAIDLNTGQWRAAERKARLESVDASKTSGIKTLIAHKDKGGQFAWKVLSQTLSYAASLVPEIADDIAAVDEAMRLGYNWKRGPFEMIDQIGVDVFIEKLKADKMPMPGMLELAKGKSFYRVEGGKLQYLDTSGKYQDIKRAQGVLLLADIKRASKPVKKNGSASLWDIGDGVLCLEFTSKMNALDDQIMAMIHEAIKLIGDGKGEWKALVIHNEGSNFSVGANLGMAMFVINIGMWPQIDEMVTGGQKAYMALKHSPFPVVSAPSGMCLGGGCEILLHSDIVVAHAESYIGLVEVGVGLLPAWGGCKEMLLRHAHKKGAPGGPMPHSIAAFETIGTAKVAKSAEEAKELLFLLDKDSVTMNRDRLLADAKKRALELAKDYKAPEKREVRLGGPGGKLALDMAVQGFALSGKATPHDVVVSDHLAKVLTGGKADHTQPVTEDHILKLEYQNFMELIKTPDSMARIEHMLETGKPLRN